MKENTPEIRVGDVISFQYGKSPATQEGKRITAMRARNMHEARTMPAYSGPWEPLYVADRVLGLDGEFVILRDQIRIKISEVTSINGNLIKENL